jgi:hypothetical protein
MSTSSPLVLAAAAVLVALTPRPGTAQQGADKPCEYACGMVNGLDRSTIGPTWLAQPVINQARALVNSVCDNNCPAQSSQQDQPSEPAQDAEDNQ